MPKSIENYPTNGISSANLEPEIQQTWDALMLPTERPSENLRRAFYRQLSASQRRRIDWLGWLRQPALVGALSLALGVVIGSQWLNGPASSPGDDRLGELQQQVASLNTTLALNLMQNAAIGDRLSGIELAAGLQDRRLDQALLTRVEQDQSQSVRSAALAALGPRISEASVWQELEQLLTQTDSELVQLALVDLILRHGTEAQLSHLARTTDQAQLFPEINQYAAKKMEQSSI